MSPKYCRASQDFSKGDYIAIDGNYIVPADSGWESPFDLVKDKKYAVGVLIPPVEENPVVTNTYQYVESVEEISDENPCVKIVLPKGVGESMSKEDKRRAFLAYLQSRLMTSEALETMKELDVVYTEDEMSLYGVMEQIKEALYYETDAEAIIKVMALCGTGYLDEFFSLLDDMPPVKESRPPFEPTKLAPGQEVVALKDIWDDGCGGLMGSWLSAEAGAKGLVLELDDGFANVMFDTGFVTIIGDDEVKVTGKDYTDNFWINHPNERIQGEVEFFLGTKGYSDE